MQKARGGQLERHPSASGVPHSRGGGSAATEHGVAACHLCGVLERPAHGLPFTDRLDRVACNGPQFDIAKSMHPLRDSRATVTAFNFVTQSGSRINFDDETHITYPGEANVMP